MEEAARLTFELPHALKKRPRRWLAESQVSVTILPQEVTGLGLKNPETSWGADKNQGPSGTAEKTLGF